MLICYDVSETEWLFEWFVQYSEPDLLKPNYRELHPTYKGTPNVHFLYY